jgi:hypothetical protein
VQRFKVTFIISLFALAALVGGALEANVVVWGS